MNMYAAAAAAAVHAPSLAGGGVQPMKMSTPDRAHHKESSIPGQQRQSPGRSLQSANCDDDDEQQDEDNSTTNV